MTESWAMFMSGRSGVWVALHRAVPYQGRFDFRTVGGREDMPSVFVFLSQRSEEYQFYPENPCGKEVSLQSVKTCVNEQYLCQNMLPARKHIQPHSVSLSFTLTCFINSTWFHFNFKMCNLLSKSENFQFVSCGQMQSQH